MRNSNYSYYRAGCSEGCLLYVHHLKTIGEIDSIKHMYSPWKDMKWSCRWLYNTAGLYDSTIDIHRESEIGLEKIIDSPVLDQWVDSYKTALANSTFSLLLLHQGIGLQEHMDKFSDEYSKCYISTHLGNWNWSKGIIPMVKQDFKIFEPIINDINTWFDESQKICKRALSNNRVLIVSNMGKACYDSYVDNNLYNISDLGYIEYPSCFGNTGPDKNHMETVSRIAEEINSVVKNYDVVIFACGGNAPVLADRVVGDVDKISIGSGLYSIFNVTPESQTPPEGVYKIPKDIRGDIVRYYGKKIVK